MPETSIVVRSFNEAEHIGDVLEAATEQEYRDFEIVLVDSGSTDGTLEIAEEYVDKIELVSPENFTFGHSCNVGCEAASGDFVSFLSAHAIPTDENWLGTMVDNLRDDDVAMTYSNQVGAETTKFSEKRLFDHLFPDEGRREGQPDYFANNASSAIRRDLWEEHRFDEYLTGHEDIEWAKHFVEEGYRVVYEPDACIYHIHDETWEQVFHRFEREAVADVEIGIKDTSDRWGEYLAIPKDIVGDTVAAVREGVFDTQTLSGILRFRYNQHTGTASGLLSKRDLESDRYEYFYGGANEKVVVDSDGNASVERSPLPEVKPNEVLIRTDYVGVTPTPTEEFDGVEEEKYPIVPEGNYVGTVADVGANANSVEVGDVVVGEKRFDCGLCSACGDSDSDGNHRVCENPIELGVDTAEGAYSRFLTAPSDHVYPLPDGVEPREGALAGTLAKVAGGIEKATSLVVNEKKCLVVGGSAQAAIVSQIVGGEGYEVDRVSPDSPEEASAVDFGEYGLVVDTTGVSELARHGIGRSAPGTVVLLLGSGYGRLTLGNGELEDKTVIRPGETAYEGVRKGMEVLSELDTEEVLDGTYALEEYESAWDAAERREAFPVIAIDS